jgi:hypothetical protein
MWLPSGLSEFETTMTVSEHFGALAVNQQMTGAALDFAASPPREQVCPASA